MGRIRGIVFDMDNTLLQSSIDFIGMKEALLRLLTETGICPPDTDITHRTASQLIEMARSSSRYEPKLEQTIWETVTRFEKEGMRGVKLEPGVKQVLERLKGKTLLTVLTNNAQDAAETALAGTGIRDWFDLIAGRERMSALKPSPSGLLYIMEQYPELTACEWIFVGDSWIDGRAAQEAGVSFVAYRGNEDELKRHQVDCVGHLNHMVELLSFIQTQ